MSRSSCPIERPLLPGCALGTHDPAVLYMLPLVSTVHVDLTRKGFDVAHISPLPQRSLSEASLNDGPVDSGLSSPHPQETERHSAGGGSVLYG